MDPISKVLGQNCRLIKEYITLSNKLLSLIYSKLQVFNLLYKNITT